MKISIKKVLFSLSVCSFLLVSFCFFGFNAKQLVAYEKQQQVTLAADARDLTIEDIINEVVKTSERFIEEAKVYTVEFDKLSYDKKYEIELYISSIKKFLDPNGNGDPTTNAGRYFKMAAEGSEDYAVLLPFKTQLEALQTTVSQLPIAMRARLLEITNKLNKLFDDLKVQKKYEYATVTEADRPLILEHQLVLKELTGEIPESYINSIPANTDSENLVDRYTGTNRYALVAEIINTSFNKLEARQLFEIKYIEYLNNELLSTPILETKVEDRDKLLALQNELDLFKTVNNIFLTTEQNTKLESIIWKVNEKLGRIEELSPSPKDKGRASVYIWVIFTAMMFIMLAFVFKLYYDSKKKKQPYYKAHNKDDNVNIRIYRGKMPETLSLYDPTIDDEKKETK